MAHDLFKYTHIKWFMEHIFPNHSLSSVYDLIRDEPQQIMELICLVIVLRVGPHQDQGVCEWCEQFKHTLRLLTAV